MRFPSSELFQSAYLNRRRRDFCKRSIDFCWEWYYLVRA